VGWVEAVRARSTMQADLRPSTPPGGTHPPNVMHSLASATCLPHDTSVDLASSSHLSGASDVSQNSHATGPAAATFWAQWRRSDARKRCTCLDL
jgi:hypothetical protein